MSNLTWRKSRRSTGVGECVEVATAADLVLVRDSKDPDGPRLAFTASAWAAFVDAVKSGQIEPK